MRMQHQLQTLFSFSPLWNNYDASSTKRNPPTALNKLRSLVRFSKLSFATKLEDALRGAAKNLPSLQKLLNEHIDRVALIPLSAIASKSRDLDERATTIWNLTSKLKDNAALSSTLASGQADYSLARRLFADPDSASFCMFAARPRAAVRTYYSSKFGFSNLLELDSAL
ncbi:MAG: hypothetical protein Q9181_001039 [Wetmoreana brouardii]